MTAEPTIPKLLEILFGEAAPTAQRLAAGRLPVWCEAFEAWLDWRRQTTGGGGYYFSVLTWRRLLQERHKMPWELTQADVEAHAAWMLDREYAASKINNSLGVIANFYRWCGEHEVDPECAPDYNPAAAAPRLKVRKYERTELLSRKEVQALLDFMRRDETPLGRRDYALILARLRLGVSLKRLLHLQWGQIEQDASGVRLRWSPSASPTQKRISSEAKRQPSNKVLPLAADAWEAIQTALAAAGRLPGMQAESYIFAPLTDPFNGAEHDTAEAWEEGRCLTYGTVLYNFKRYGRRLGLPEAKISLRALHRTATRLRLEDGYTVEEMKAFLESTDKPYMVRFRLGRLPPLPPDAPPEQNGREAPDEGSLPPLPGRLVRHHDRRTHGMYARSQPPEAVAAILAEDIQGIDEELAGLRGLARALLEPPAGTRKSGDVAQLTAAYTQAATRLSLMIEAEKELAKVDAPDGWSMRFLAMLDKVAEKTGGTAVSPVVLGEVYGGKARMGISDRRVREEIAATRYALRNTLAFASDELKISAYIRLVEVYGDGCVRLLRLLKAGQGGQNRLETTLRESMDQAIREVTEELGLS